MLVRSLILIVILISAASPLWGGNLPVPKLTARVTDLAGALSAEQREILEDELRRYEDTTGNQFVVLIIPSLEDDILEEYALEVAEANGIGSREHDNGLLILVAIAERKIRIEVGYGLEGALPDILTADIRDREIVPRFREGDYFSGLLEGLRGLMAAAAGEYRAEPRESEYTSDGGSLLTLVIIIIVLFIIIRAARRGGGGRGGGIGVPWIIPTSGWRGGWGGGGGGWGGGSRGGGGGFGGGGFSGGGGSFGGGGSSGGW